MIDVLANAMVVIVLQYIHVHAKVASVVSDSLQPYGLYPNRLFCPWNSQGKNTGVGCHALLQGIFLTQGSNPHLLRLLYRQVISLPLAPPGKPVAIYTYIKSSPVY